MVALTQESAQFRTATFDRERARDFVGMVECAYDLEADEVDWRVAVATAVGAALADEMVAVWDYEVPAGFDRVEVRQPVFVNAGPEDLAAVAAATQNATPDSMAALFTGPLVGAASETLGDPVEDDPRITDLAAVGVGDFIVFRAPALDRTGLAVAFLKRNVAVLSPSTRHALECVAVHIAAARRLRRRLRSSAGEPAAILDPCGRLLHVADEAAKAKRPRDALTEAVAQLSACRGRLRRENPEQALDLWQGLVRGRWSLIERIDTDGKRFLVARRNDEHAPDPRALTIPERRVAGYAALGHANKVVAYELGIAPSTVSRHLGNALRKLGLKSKVELVSMGFRRDDDGSK